MYFHDLLTVLENIEERLSHILQGKMDAHRRNGPAGSLRRVEPVLLLLLVPLLATPCD